MKLYLQRHVIKQSCLWKNNMIRGEFTTPPESAQGLWYDPAINRFIDEDGHILHDLHQYFDLWQLDEWKKTRDYGLLVDRQGNLWELYYTDDDICDELCDHTCNTCDSKCEVYEMFREWEHEKITLITERKYFDDIW